MSPRCGRALVSAKPKVLLSSDAESRPGIPCTAGVSDAELTEFDLERDLVAIRSGATPYGTIILGKIRIPAIADGYVHVRSVAPSILISTRAAAYETSTTRIHDPPDRVCNVD